MSDADLDYLIGEYEKSNAQLNTLTDEELAELARVYEAPGGGAGDVAPKVDAPPPELSTSETIAGGFRELAGGAAFEFADEAEAAARAAATGKSYDEVVNEIRLERAKFNEAHPVLGPALNIAGGIGSMFIPGVGAVGKTIQAGTRISKLASPLARTAASSALAGGVAGFGSGEGLTDSLGKAAIGTALGAPLGVVAHGVGDLVKFGRGALSARGAELGDEEAARKAAEIISRRIAEGGLDNAKIAELAELAASYGIDNLPFGGLSPELSRLTENVVNTPSGEQADLARRLFNVQSSAPQRVKSLAKDAVPTPDYFATEESVLKTLRDNAERNYGSGWQNVEVRDPRIMQVLDDPAIRSAYMDALGNSRLQQQEAILNGVDPSQYKLREIFDPIMDAEGAVVGLSPTGKMAPDMGTLNQVKIALDRKISSLYASGQGGQATSLRGLRDAFVKRLDEVGPAEFKAARNQYKGDIEIKEALEQGKNSAGLRWQQFGKFMKDYSLGEQQAFKTGFMQQVLKGFEDTGTRQNFAKNLLKENSLKKFQSVMDPGEFQVFEAALKREEQLFNDIGQATGNSATFRRAAEREDIQNQIAGGNIDDAVALFVNPTPGNIAIRTARFLANMRNANVSRATYTQLARMLKANTPDEIEEVLTRLEAAAPVQQAADRALERRVTKGGVAAASTLAPPPKDTRGQLSDDFEVTVPSLTEEDPTGLSAMPGGDYKADVEIASFDPELGEYVVVDDATAAPMRNMYRGGTVQAFGNGGQPKKQTSFFDDALMAVSRRSNDLVAAAADLADKYGLTVPDTTAWIAQNVAGYSPQQANQIRKNLGGMSNRGVVEAGATSNEARFRNAGGRGARSADMVSAPVRMSDVAYRVQDIPRAVVSETPKALRAAGNYITNTSPQTMLSDAQRVGSAALNAIKEDPYGIAVDTALYPAFPVAASMGDFAAMRGGARQLSPYARGDAEAAKAKAMVDALSVLPIGGGMAGRRVARRR